MLDNNFWFEVWTILRQKMHQTRDKRPPTAESINSLVCIFSPKLTFSRLDTLEENREIKHLQYIYFFHNQSPILKNIFLEAGLLL